MLPISPKEPSPAPPPLSLNDLFKNISPAQPPSTSPGQKAKLLDMLSTTQQDKFAFVSPFDALNTTPSPQPVSEKPSEEQAVEGSGGYHAHQLTKGMQGQGPQSTPSHIMFDLSKSNLASLIDASPSPIDLQPITLSKNESQGWKIGRKVGLTRGFVAYTLSKGKIRLLDSRSGARLMLQAQTPTPGPVLDLSVNPVYIAALASDRSIWVWRIPSSWTYDNPPVDLCLVAHTMNGPIGAVQKIQWVRKNGGDSLVVGGEGGVVVLEISKERGVRNVEDVFKSKTLLKTSGNMVDFCVNANNTAIGLLSSTSTFTLYNLTTYNRVWQRSLPSSCPNLPLTSCQFVETNILIGRERNTCFDLVQITADLAVLSSITLQALGAGDQHYAQALYDPYSSLLFIAPHLRSSLLVFHYTLKNTQPIRDVSLPNGPRVVAFDKLAELPLDKENRDSTDLVPLGDVQSLAIISNVGNDQGWDQNIELFWSCAAGFGSGVLGLKGVEMIGGGKKIEPEQAPAVAHESASNTASSAVAIADEVAMAEPASTTAPALATLAPAFIPAATSSTRTTTPSSVEATSTGIKGIKKEKKSQKSTPAISTKSLPEEDALSKEKMPAQSIHPLSNTQGNEIERPEEAEKSLDTIALSRMEQNIISQFKDVLSSELSPLASSSYYVSSPQFTSSLSSSLSVPVSFSILSTVKPALEKCVKEEVAKLEQSLKGGVTSQVGRTVEVEMGKIGKNLEKSLGSVISRTVASAIHTSVDRLIQESIQTTLLPALTSTTQNLTEHLLSEMRSELLQIRKELEPPSAKDAHRGQVSAEEEMKRVTQELEEMKNMLSGLKEIVLGRGTTGAFNAPVSTSQTIPLPIPSSTSAGVSKLPSPEELNDTFLLALSAQKVPVTLQLVSDHLAMTDYLFSMQNGKAVLVQAVLLTLLHRVSVALSELPPSHPLYIHLLTWSRRSVILLDSKDASIASYLVRVLSIVQDLLNRLLAGPHIDPHIGQIIREILNVTDEKLRLASY
nr:hypothetical protein L204_00632 [Cryptococcus depauperatus CBS 7855]